MICSVCKKKEAKYRMGDEGSFVTSYYCSKSCIGQRTIEVHHVEKIAKECLDVKK